MIGIINIRFLLMLFFVVSCSRNEIPEELLDVDNEIDIAQNDSIDSKSVSDSCSFLVVDNEVQVHSSVPCLNEDSCWRIVYKNNTIEEYKSFISCFPHGKYFKKAKKELAKLESKSRINDIGFKDDFRKDFPIDNINEGYKGTYQKFVDKRDDKTYNILKIGDVFWFAENLKYKPLEGKFWAYDNNPFAVDVYGYLYDWQTAMKSCPSGWRLPDDKDWSDLEYLLLRNTGVAVLKSVNNWRNSSFPASNRSGFSAIPSGIRTESGYFVSQNSVSFWWTATEVNKTQAFYRNITSSNSELYRYYDSKKSGFSVRCVK